MKLEIQKILVPIDFSACARTALRMALDLARQHGAEVHLVHVMMAFEEDPYSLVYPLPDRHQIYRQQEDACRLKMEEVLASSDPSGIKVHHHLTRALVTAPNLVEFSGEHKIDLILMGGHGRRGWRRFLLGSVAEEVVRLALCPVLTVREDSSIRPDLGNGRILVPVDFSQHSRQALRVARDMLGPEGRLHVVHVVEHPVYPQIYDPAAGQILFPQMTPRIEAAIHDFVVEVLGEEAPQQPEWQVKILEGRAAETITKEAEGSASDLIVITTHGLTGLEHLLLGSVTEKVVRGAECPVLTLKPGTSGP